MRRFIILLSAVALLSTAAFAAFEPTVNFSSISDAGIFFDGAGNFVFDNDGAGNSFAVGSTANLPAGLVGKLGTITGTYAIGAITTVGSKSTAPITTSPGAALIIDDGSGSDFTANIEFVDITQDGSGGQLNTTASVNLLNFSYGGGNAALSALAGYPAGIVTVTFQFVPPVSLSDLKNAPADMTSYSGTLVAVPEPSAYAALLGSGLAAAVWLRQRLTRGGSA